MTLPAWIAPQLATLVAAPPPGDAWVHEIKLDGYRILLRVARGRVRLLTRNRQDWTERFPAAVEAAARLPVKEALLDGEIVVFDAAGVSSFQALQQAVGRGAGRSLVYVAFDLLFLDGRDLRLEPLLARKKELARLLEGRRGALRYSEHFDEPGQKVYERACRMALEGIVSKRKQAPYTAGRGQAWLKVKCVARQEFVIGGYTDPEGARVEFGSLLLGVHEPDGRLVYAGRVGTGFSRATLAALGKRLRKLGQRGSPFAADGPRPPMRGAHWVKPVLVAEVAFTEWTRDGLLRHPAFEGLREDKPAAAVVRERARAPKPAPAKRRIQGGSDTGAAVAGVRLTHPERVLYPDQAITKLALARYYEAVADWILPHVADRPLSLVRCPEGQPGPCFYQKHAGPGVPKEVKRVRIRESGGGTASYLYLDDLAGVVALTQIGVLEIHTWGAQVARLDRPDRLLLDLDPAPGLPWTRVVEAAQEIHALLADLDLVAFVKTTGGKGLHVVVPLRPEAGWDALRALGEGIGAELARRAPDRYTINPLKAARRGRIFVDYLRNVRGATAVAAYSTRARPGAPVSTPLGWSELAGKTRPGDFTVETVPKRLASLRRDPWADFFSVDQAITSRTARALASAGRPAPAPPRRGRARARRARG
ncbi:MAG TPA: DNA ligase D [Methylomirabilota bacterium]|nr:DNA ligase D [Methylomirabilota bacterium]